MFNTKEMMLTIAKNTLKKHQIKQTDYTDEEGFLNCGDCHTRREYYAKAIDEHLPCLCQCRLETREKEEIEEQNKKDMEFIKSLKEVSMMDARFLESKFENFKETEYNSFNLKLCKRYAYDFKEMQEKNQGLIMLGPPGTGKTYASACIANHLLDHKTSVVMTSFVNLLSIMQSFKDNKEPDTELLRKINKAKLLVIDDLGAERTTDYAIEKVYHIIDSRYRNQQPIILTTNNNFDALKEETDIRYTRIYDRIFSMCYPMEFGGLSFRKKEAYDRDQEMRKFLER